MPRKETAHKWVSTRPSQTTHPTVAASEAALQGKGSGSRQKGGSVLRLTDTSLQPCGCSSCLAAPKSVCCGLGSLLWRPGGYFKLNLQFCFCIYACLKACTPSSFTLKQQRISLSNQCPQKCFQIGFNPFIKASDLFLC